MCIALVDIPVGDTGAVVFSLVRAFPTVTFCANKAGLTPVAFVVVYYILFVAISIPLLLVTPFITALSIRRIMRSVSQCSLNMKERAAID